MAACTNASTVTPSSRAWWRSLRSGRFFCHIRAQSEPTICVRCNQKVRLLSTLRCAQRVHKLSNMARRQIQLGSFLVFGPLENKSKLRHPDAILVAFMNNYRQITNTLNALARSAKSGDSID
jgi:hypothetical protein